MTIKDGDILLAKLRAKAARRDGLLALCMALLQPKLSRLELIIYAIENRN